MWDFWSHLFDPSGFPPRWNCGAWTPGHGWLHILSDLGVWSAYFAIPCVLAYYAARRRPFRLVLVLFVAFILSCGLTHLMEAVIFWWPAYRLAGVLKLLTAVLSWATVVALVRVTPRVMAFRSPTELEEEIARRKRAEELIQVSYRESEQRYRMLLEGVPQLVWTCLPDGQCDFLSRQWMEYTGVPEAEHLGSGWRDAVHPDDRPHLTERWSEAVGEGRPLDVEFRIRGAAGEYRWFKTRAVLFQNDDGSRKWFGTNTDIHDRRLAEERVRESEERFRQLIDSIPQLAWTARPDGRIFWYNRRWYDYTGTTPDQMEGCGWQDFHDPDELPKVLEGWRGSIADGKPFETVLLLRGADGQFRPFLTRVFPLCSPEGRVIQWFGTNTDIENQKRIENALRRSEEIYRAIGESIDYGVWVCDPTGRNIYASPSFLNLVGLTQQQCAEFGWGDRLHPDDADRTIAAWKECVGGRGKWDIEHRFRGVDGQWHPILARGVAVTDEQGRITAWAGINLDIGRLKRAETALRDFNVTLEQRVEERTKALRLEEERFQSAFDHAPIGMALVAPDGRWLQVNRSLCELVGYTETELHGMDFQTLTHPDDLETDLGNLRDMLAGKTRTYQLEKRYFHKQGRVIDTLLSVSLVLNADGSPAHFIAQIKDITERKRAEELLRASLREKEVLLKEIHHRVKNNLQIISTLLDLQSGHTNEPTALAMFQESRGRVRSMALIHERLYRSQDMARVDFGEYIRQLADDLYRTYQISDEIRLELEVDIPPLTIDIAIPCGLLLNELLSNCFKHAFAGAKKGCLRVALHRDDGASVLIVSDDGAGFPAGIDFRNTTSFGLQLVNTLVDQLDGEVGLTTGRGTTFTVRFPKTTAQSTGKRK